METQVYTLLVIVLLLIYYRMYWYQYTVLYHR
jgi:hypothetical protein